MAHLPHHFGTDAEHIDHGYRVDRIAPTPGGPTITPKATANDLAPLHALITEHAHDLVIALDTRGLIVMSNATGRALLGLRADAGQRISSSCVTDPDDRSTLRHAIRRAASTLHPIRMTVTLTTITEGPIPMDLAIRCLPGAVPRERIILITGSDARTRLAREHTLTEHARQADRELAEHVALRRIATAAAGHETHAQVMKIAASATAELIGVECAFIGRFDQHDCVIEAFCDPARIYHPGERIHVASEPVIAHVHDTISTARYAHATPGDLGFCSTAAAPVIVEGVVWGLIMAGSRHCASLSRENELQLMRIADIVAVAVHAEHTRAHLARQAMTDSLTGLPNQRAFQERLTGEVARARRFGRPVTLAILDLDHFKDLNDAHGHPTGDAVLIEVAERLGACIRQDEMIARIGGEEFAWILPETDATKAFEAIERARRAVSSTPVGDEISISLSAGICDLVAAHDSTDQLIRRADRALYWAKSHGRDQAFAFSDEIIPETDARDYRTRSGSDQVLHTLKNLVASVDPDDPEQRENAAHVAQIAAELATRLGWPSENAPSRTPLSGHSSST